MTKGLSKAIMTRSRLKSIYLKTKAQEELLRQTSEKGNEYNWNTVKPLFSHKQIESGKLTLIKGALSGLRQFIDSENHLKMMKNTFLFSLKNSFRSQDISIFVFVFWSCRKMA